ncbi:MAG: Mth938-like domain-containing protein [Pseudomonadota bacterium]
MKFTREQSEGIYTVHAFTEDGVCLNSPDPGDDRDEAGRITLNQSFILSPTSLLRHWGPTGVDALTPQQLEAIAALQPQVLLLGSGTRLRFPQQNQLEALVGLGIGYEVMDSAAACRTYNILAGEGRRVAAAIIIED